MNAEGGAGGGNFSHPGGDIHTCHSQFRKKPIIRVATWTLLVLFGLVGLWVFVGSPLLGVYDRAHQVGITCTVLSAEVTKSSASGRGAATTAMVVVTTKECGKLAISKGVTTRNQNDIAHLFHSGDSYIFFVGEGSLALRPFLEAINITLLDFSRFQN